MLTDKEKKALKEYFLNIDRILRDEKENKELCLNDLYELGRIHNLKKGIQTRLEESTTKSIFGIFLFINKFVEVIKNKY